MASTIVTKNSSTASAVPLTGDLTQGELAVNVTDKRLFTKNSGGTVVELGTNPASLALPNGTANGVAYLNGSKVLTTGSALTFNGSKLEIASSGEQLKLTSSGDFSSTGTGFLRFYDSVGAKGYVGYGGSASRFDINTGTSMNLNMNAVGGTMTFQISNSEQMRLTSTGLGIGTSSPSNKLDVSGAGSTVAQVTNTNSTGNTVASLRLKSGSNYYGFYTSNTQNILSVYDYQAGADRVILDSSGNLGLGVTPSASWFSGAAALQFGVGGGLVSSSSYTGLTRNTIATSAGFAAQYLASAAASMYLQGNGTHEWYTAPSGTAGNAISFTQAMTLDASGNLLVGITSASGRRLWVAGSNAGYISTIQNDNSSPLGLQIYHPTDVNGTGNSFLVCVGNATNRVELRSNGGIGNYSANNVNLSDERLKNNIQYAGNYLAKICAIPVRTFKYKDQTDDLLNLGVIAQEVETVAPELVDSSGFGETPEDGVPLKAIYQTDLQYALMKCIQEQQALIQQLQADVAALKGN